MSRLFLKRWEPLGQSRAAVAIVHGFGEHCELYSEVADFLTGRSLAVFCADLRGHGRSPGRRGHIDSWSDYRDDVGEMMESVRAHGSGLPVFLLGNSMGGLIAVDYAIHHPDNLTGVALIAPAVGEIGVHPLLLRLARGLSRVWPTFTMKSGIERSRLTRDPAAIARLDADPLVHSLGTARLGSEVQDVITELRQNANRLLLPTFILHGEGDQVTSPASSREFLERVGATDKVLKIYPGGFHNLVIDIIKDAVLRDIENWITHQLATATG